MQLPIVAFVVDLRRLGRIESLRQQYQDWACHFLCGVCAQ